MSIEKRSHHDWAPFVRSCIETTLVASLRPAIEAAAEEIDVSGEIPVSLYEALRESGAFSLLTPRELGGLEVSLPESMRIYEELGHIDASVAWVVWNANFGFLGALLDESGVTQIWGSGRTPSFANSGIPMTAESVEGGYLITAKWKIVSGIRQADWLIGLAKVTDNSVPVLTESGGPDIRIIAVPRNQLTVEDTWHTSGMRGSGSHNAQANGILVPSDLVVRRDQGTRINRPLYRGSTINLIFPGCTPIVLGVAQAAIHELVRLAPVKTIATGEKLADSPRVQLAIAKSEAELHAARLLFYAAIEDLHVTAERDEPVTPLQRAALRAAMTHAAQVSREVLSTMYELGSSASFYVGNTLERLFRDAMVALQHVNFSPAYLEAAGRVRLGREAGIAPM